MNPSKFDILVLVYRSLKQPFGLHSRWFNSDFPETLTQEEKEVYVTEKERFDTYFDLDHDGRLNDTEIFRWLIPDDNATAAAEAEHIMEKSDTNKDGVLSTNEIAEHYLIFVGSEVTDYGNALTQDYAGGHDELWTSWTWISRWLNEQLLSTELDLPVSRFIFWSFPNEILLGLFVCVQNVPVYKKFRFLVSHPSNSSYQHPTWN